jgi:hypothetical protein
MDMRTAFVKIAKMLHAYDKLNWILRAATFYTFYRGRPYAEFYAECVNRNASHDPQKAVGGRWEELGQLQFDFLVSHMVFGHATPCLT